MREILFRGQTRRYGERVWMNGEKVPGNWVYGGIFPGTGDFSVIYGANKEDFTGADIAKHTVYSDTVGQFIGLTDKNGTRIFEGDVVRFHMFRDEPDWVGEIKYELGLYLIVGNFPNRFEVQVSSRDKSTFEVIGNIHDNPELIGERRGNDEP